MADNKPNQKRDFKTVVEDARALATVLAMEAESVFGRRTARDSGGYPKTASDMTASKVAYPIVGAVVVVFLLQVGYAWWVFQEFPNRMATRGQFGDLFGAVNAFFTGLAFAGVIFTIFLQRRELETTTRLSVIATLVDAYTSQIDTTEQGKFRGQLWRADYKFRSWAEEVQAKEKVAKPLGVMIARYIDENPHDKDPDDPEFRNTAFRSTYEALNDPVFRSSYEAWVHARQQRDHFLKILEEMSKEVEGARQGALVGAESDKRI